MTKSKYWYEVKVRVTDQGRKDFYVEQFTNPYAANDYINDVNSREQSGDYILSADTNIRAVPRR